MQQVPQNLEIHETFFLESFLLHGTFQDESMGFRSPWKPSLNTVVFHVRVLP